MESSVTQGENAERPLYNRMMKSIDPGHTWGNRMRMLKLPLILTDTRLYACAIAQFYQLTKTLEGRLRECKNDALVARVATLGLNVTPGYEADLAQLLGPQWSKNMEHVLTPATTAYCAIIEQAKPVELTAASFILYGALVIGGGKMTQKKVKRVFPSCEHMLFDVAEDMVKARRDFKALFTDIGKEFPEHADELAQQAARFMALNNTVVLSIRCIPFWWWRAATIMSSTAVAIGVALALRRHRSGKVLGM